MSELLDDRTAPAQPVPGAMGAPAPLAPDDVADLVRRYGLHRAGARAPLVAYTRALWARRHFVRSYSTASNSAGYSRSYLGQAWHLLTPLLNVAVYFLVFGVLLHTKRGVHNFIAFLAVGIFVFAFSTGSVTGGARAIRSNLGLTRALPFPRAMLPVSTTLIAFQKLLYSMIIMVPIVLLTGEPITLHWLELIPAVGLQAMFCLGLAFLFARVGAKIPDVSQMLPFVLRVWMYTSGILYSITVFSKGHAPWVKTVLDINPGGLYVRLARHALITGNPVAASDWLLALGWGVALLVIGYIVFWQGEEEYGRV